MHTFNGRSCNIHYNANLQGRIIITPKFHSKGENSDSIGVDIDDVIDFLATAARQRAVEKLDEQFGNKSGREILGL